MQKFHRQTTSSDEEIDLMIDEMIRIRETMGRPGNDVINQFNQNNLNKPFDKTEKLSIIPFPIPFPVPIPLTSEFIQQNYSKC